MSRFIAVILAGILISACTGGAQTNKEAGLNLIPWPAQIEQHPGQFVMTDQMTVAADAAFAAEGAQLAKCLPLRSGDTGAGIRLVKVEGLADEAYTLDIGSDGVAIKASTPAGAFYGCQTLRQLVTGRTVPFLHISDQPRIAWRGFMLDVSRQFFDKAQVEGVLDQMSALKLNVFHWHLTDDHGWRIEIKKYPKLTSVGAWRKVNPLSDKEHIQNGVYGGYYTQNDIRDIVAYATALHIQVVPEIDMPSHMSAAVASYPEMGTQDGWKPIIATNVRSSGERCSSLCVARPQVIQFCKDVLEEVMALFPSREIHIGGDEVFYEQWAADPEMNAYKQKLNAKDWEDVQVAFGNEMAAFLIEKGRTPIVWNNIYRQTVDKRVINHFWRGMGPARDFANSGYKVLLSPYVYYFDHAWSLEDAYRYDPLDIGVKMENQSRITGIEGCAWTPRIDTVPDLEKFIYPRLVAIAESGWTPPEKKDWDSFQRRLMYSSAVPASCRKSSAERRSDGAQSADDGNCHLPAARAKNTDWFSRAGWGLFVHYVYLHQCSGNLPVRMGGVDDWNQCVNEFDTEKFADQVKETGASYVIFTVMQLTRYMIAPNETYDRLTGFKPGEACSTRDLIEDLYQSLNKRGVKLMLYWTGDGPFRDPQASNGLGHAKGTPVQFVKNWGAVAAEYGERYKDKIAGWWVDGCYDHDGYNNEKWTILANAMRAGNPNRIISLNQGTAHFLSTNQIDDFMAGERNDFDKVPTSRWRDGVQWHILSFLGNNWGDPAVRCNSDWMANYVRICNRVGGVVSIDASLYRDGSLDKAQLECLTGMNRQLSEWKGGMAFTGNLALFKPAHLLNLDGTTELGASAGHIAAYGVDGKLNTFAEASGQYPWTYQVDLEEVLPISRIVVEFDPKSYATQFNIAVSDDGKVWRTVLEKKEHDGSKVEVKFAAVGTRYIQVLGIKPDAPGQQGRQMGITELEVYNR